MVLCLLSAKNEACGIGRVVVLVNLTYAGSRENLANCDQDSRFRFVQGDIGDSEMASRLLSEEKIDSVFHLSAEARVDQSIDCRRLTFRPT